MGAGAVLRDRHVGLAPTHPGLSFLDPGPWPVWAAALFAVMALGAVLAVALADPAPVVDDVLGIVVGLTIVGMGLEHRRRARHGGSRAAGAGRLTGAGRGVVSRLALVLPVVPVSMCGVAGSASSRPLLLSNEPDSVITPPDSAITL